MSEQFNEQYIAYCKNRTPEMWKRIEASIIPHISEEPSRNIDPIVFAQNIRKKRPIQKWAPLLAASFIVVIGIPMWFLFNRSMGSDAPDMAPKMSLDMALEFEPNSNEMQNTEATSALVGNAAAGNAPAVYEEPANDGVGVMNESVSNEREATTASCTTESGVGVSEVFMTVRIVKIKESTDMYKYVYMGIVEAEDTNLVDVGREITIYLDDVSTPLELNKEYSGEFVSLNGIMLEEETEFLLQ